MDCIASYTTETPIELRLHDVESQAFVIAFVQDHDKRRSLRWRAEAYCAQEGHTIAAWDYSGLTNGEVAG